jgi:eukaryotic-like serine/threonine-protein kinase
MTEAQWNRIQSVYHELSEVPAAEREAAVRAACADDPVVLDEVLALLRAEDEDTEESALDSVVQRVAYDVASAQVDRVGPYRLVKEIGRGGMGTVYLGTRDDNEFTRKVAIKFLNMGMDRPEYQRRFRQERQILADLEHPNIARLLEGGQAGSGQPYLVMEFVDGKPLHQYCRDKKLSRAEILELFVRVCDAVDYAHSHLVVHRDLKPSNILVTQEGIPKLLDFGIAKVLAQRGENEPLTQNTSQMLTLDYASPEQISGEPISTVSDVYSLGVILYELLAHERPFQPRESQPLVYCVLHGDIVKPSERARKKGLSPIPPELDNVILKAMAREPIRRYRSAASLAEDLRRHMKGEAVLAHGDSTWYVASKFVRRHLVASTVAASLALAVVALAIQLAVTNQRLARERDTAVRERSNARATNSFLVNLFIASDPLIGDGTPMTPKGLLDRGAEQLRQEAVTDPALRANLLMGIGGAYSRMGEWQEARTHLDESLALLRELGEEGIEIRAEVLIEYTNTLERVGELTAAEGFARELVEINREYRPHKLASSLSALGNALAHQMKYAEAEKAYREGLTLVNPGPESADTSLRANLAIALFRQGRFREAEELVSEVRDLMRTYWGAQTPTLAFTYDTEANMERVRGNYTKSVKAFGRAIEIFRGAQEEELPMLAYQYCGLAETYLRMRDEQSAAAWLDRCDGLRTPNVRPDSFDAIALLQLRGVQDLLNGEIAEAESKFRRALSLQEHSFGNESLVRARGLRYLGIALRSTGNLEEADNSFAEAMRLHTSFGKGEDPEYTDLLLEKATTSIQRGRLGDADQLLRRVIRIRRDLRMAQATITEAELRLAASLTEQGKLEEAERLLNGALEHFQKQPSEVRGQEAEAHLLLAKVLTRKGQRSEAAARRARGEQVIAQIPPGAWRTWLLSQ